MRTKWFIHSLRIFWLFFILNHEFFAFWSSAKSCALNSSGKFMLIADPQMTDDKSYKTNRLFLTLSKFYSDLYMIRNYKYLTRFIQPTDIFITGDLMDNGREWEDTYFHQEVNRFHKLFRSIHKKHYMVGNHDIGFGNGVKQNIQERYKSYFGNTSYILETNTGYSFIVIDTVSLSSDDPHIRASALAVLNSPLPETKRILMTHVPLYRDSSVPCGPFRQNKNTIIKNQYGYQYQNLISYELSAMLLNTIQPVAVFSGDDHDYCKVFHQYNDNTAVEPAMEITLPTFSMAQGMRYPGVMILDLSNPTALTTELCWLPDQIGIFLRYGYLTALTFIILILYHSFQYTSTIPQQHFLSLSKEEMGMTTSPFNPLKHCIYSFFHSVKDVALTSLPIYIFCILLI